MPAIYHQLQHYLVYLSAAMVLAVCWLIYRSYQRLDYNRISLSLRDILPQALLVLLAFISLEMKSLLIDPLAEPRFPWFIRTVFEYSIFFLIPEILLLAALGYSLALWKKIRDIDRKQKEFEDRPNHHFPVQRKTLKDLEDQFPRLYNLIPQRMYLKDMKGVYRSVNAAFAASLKKTPEEIIGRNDHDLFADSLARATYIEDMLVIRRVEDLNGVARDAAAPKGIKYTKMPVYDDDHTVSGVLAIFWDTWDPKETEKQLRDSQIRYSALADYTYDWEYWQDQNGQYQYISPACERISGYSAAELMENPELIYEMILPRFRDKLREHARNVNFSHLPDDTHEAFEYQIQCRDGQRKWLDHRCSPVFSDTGVFLGRRGVNRDITIKQAAIDEMNKLSAAVEQSPVSVVITDIEGNIEYVNPRFCQITGYSAEVIIGRNSRILNSGYHSSEFYRELWATINSGKNWTGEFRNRKKNGDLFWEDASIGPIMNNEGEISRFVALKMDITRQKTLLDKESMLQNQLIQNNKLASLGVLSAGLAHEINNPNNYIMYNSELVKSMINEFVETRKDCQFPKRDLEVINTLLNAISDGTARINRIIESLKSFSRQGETDDLMLDIVQVNHLVEVVLTMMNYHIKKMTDNFEFVAGPEIPTGYWDAQKIEQVLLNLIENALEALPDRKKAIQVITDYRAADETVCITVRDEGIGIQPDIIQNIFEPFFSTRKSSGGTGLGLSISYAIIREHQGDILVHSEPGKGTKFEVLLPLNKAKVITP